MTSEPVSQMEMSVPDYNVMITTHTGVKYMSVQTAAKHHGTGLIIPLWTQGRIFFFKNVTAQEKPGDEDL